MQKELKIKWCPVCNKNTQHQETIKDINRVEERKTTSGIIGVPYKEYIKIGEQKQTICKECGLILNFEIL